jgi:hypothetical protein
MLWTQGRLLRGGGLLFVPYDFLFLHGPYGMPVFRQMGIDEQQKFSDLDLISRLGWRSGGVWARLLTRVISGVWVVPARRA